MGRNAIQIRHVWARTLPFYLLLATLIGTLVIHLLVLLYRSYLNHDVAFNLTAGKMTYEGMLPFVGVIDINPPMIMYLNAIPAAISASLGISLPTAGLFFFLFLVMLTGWVFTESLSLNIRLSWNQRFLTWTFWLWLSLRIFQNDSFGQREQLILLFLTPLVCMRHARYSGTPVRTWLALLIAALAFLALAMKPQYALPLAMVEAAFFLGRRRTFRPVLKIEAALFLMLGVVYLLHFLVVPGMSSFYTVWSPFGLKGYSAFSQSKRILVYNLAQAPYFLWFLGIAVLATVTPRVCRRRFWLVVGALGWFCLGSLLVCINQAKGWEYHRVPFLYGTQLALFLSFLYLVRTQIVRNYRPLLLALGGVGLFLTCSPEIVTLVNDVREKQPLEYPRPWLAELINTVTEPSEAVVIQGTSVSPTFSALTYTGRPYGSRFLTGYPIVFIFHDSADYVVPEQWREEEPLIYQMIASDIERSQPRLFLVRSVPKGQGLPGGFVYAEYLKRKGFFDTTLRDYRRIGFSSGFDIYYLPRIQADGEPEAIPVSKLRTLEKNGILRLDESFREK